MGPILTEIRTVRQVHAASVMISIHLDTSLGSLQHILVSASPACSASVVDKSFIRAVMMGFACQTAGHSRHVLWRCPSPHSCCGDAHLVGLPVFPLIRLSYARAVVMVFSLSGFTDIFSIIWSNSSLMVMPGTRSCPE